MFFKVNVLRTHLFDHRAVEGPALTAILPTPPRLSLTPNWLRYSRLAGQDGDMTNIDIVACFSALIIAAFLALMTWAQREQVRLRKLGR